MRCRFLYAATLLLALAPAAAQAQLGSDDALGPDEPSVVVLSERLGTVIDAHERAYFGLFPGVEGFTEARAFAGEADSVRVVIAREQTADSVVVLARPVARALGRFVETFEQHRTARVHPAWAVVSAYVQGNVRVPYVRSYGRLKAFVEGGSYAGHPVYVSDSLVVLSEQGRPGFDWQSFEGDGYVVRVDEIERVQLRRGLLATPYAPVMGMALGALINEAAMLVSPPDPGLNNRMERSIAGAAFGGLILNRVQAYLMRKRPYEDVEPEVALAAWFTPEARAPELPPDEALAHRLATRPAPTPPALAPFGTFDVGMGVTMAPAAQTYGHFTNFDHDDTEREVQFLGTFTVETGLTLRPKPWLGTGLTLIATPDLDLTAADEREVAFSRPSVNAFIDVDLLRLYNPHSRFGLAVGGGLSYAESVVTRRFPENWATTYDPASYEVRARGLRPLYAVTLEAGLMLETALFVRVLRVSAPAVNVPQVEVQSVAFPGTVVFAVDPHTVTFDRFGVLFGLRAGI